MSFDRTAGVRSYAARDYYCTHSHLGNLRVLTNAKVRMSPVACCHLPDNRTRLQRSYSPPRTPASLPQALKLFFKINEKSSTPLVRLLYPLVLYKRCSSSSSLVRRDSYPPLSALPCLQGSVIAPFLRDWAFAYCKTYLKSAKTYRYCAASTRVKCLLTYCRNTGSSARSGGPSKAQQHLVS